MDKDFTTEIHGHCVEYFAEDHTYLVDGILLPSITGLVRKKVGFRYGDVPPDVLREAARRGTEVHEAIEAYVKEGKDSDLPEVLNFRFLCRCLRYDVFDSEVPVVLFFRGDPVAAGRVDLVISRDGILGGADIKRTATLDKEYLFWQLNLYRIAYEQSYFKTWEFLRGIHLRDNIRKSVKIPINEDMVLDYVREVVVVDNKPNQGNP